MPRRLCAALRGSTGMIELKQCVALQGVGGVHNKQLRSSTGWATTPCWSGLAWKPFPTGYTGRTIFNEDGLIKGKGVTDPTACPLES